MFGVFVLFVAVFVNVMLHELGHMIVAKMSGYTVPEYSIGMGPLLFKHTVGGTQYSIRLLPIGGFCSISELEGSGDEISYSWKAIPTLLAGVAMNMIIFFLCMYLACASFANGPQYNIVTKVEDVANQTTSLQVGDIIINSETQDYLVLREGKKTTVKVEEDLQYEKQLMFKSISTGKAYKKMLMLSLGSTSHIGEAIKTSIGHLFNFEEDFKAEDGLSIVAGGFMFFDVSDIMSCYKMASIWLMTSLIGLSLGFMNILPIPCLDGGRVALVLLNKITFGRINKKWFISAIDYTFVAVMGLSLIIMLLELIRLC